ncbi:GntR family transcriptional regulator [Sedimentitalea todarodis]|uniref:GntR family transcriptional regulator n=1 Tax=Sedimentitalea todarodis TaxID=1631240 RepID=A0ABU3VDG9_9RHOB|nr:GntR family transcriptional regulator [Sedimentitalea todarodis]
MARVNKAAERTTSGPVQTPAHEVVYQQLREQILFGEMAPGQAVTIQGLTTSLGAGMTPVREAIRRLISDGALVFQGNRRVSVPILNSEDAEQIIYLRKTIEKELARRAALRVKDTDIDRLTEIDNALDHAIAIGDVSGYLQGNYQFHTTLYAHANAPVLAEIADRLWLRFGPSLRVVCGRLGTQSLPDRHKEILTALREGHADVAAHALVQDVEQGMELVAAVLAEEN